MKGRKQIFSICLLRSFCPPHLLEEIEGDLLQKFEHNKKTFGEAKAKRKLFWNVIRFFRFEILIRNKMPMLFGSMQMFSNYFKTTYRHAAKNKINFGFRLGGLTLALFSFLIIAI